MKLSKKEEAMLAGECGLPVQRSMELLVKLGELFDAEKMVEVPHVHVAATTIHALGSECAEYVAELADQGGTFAVTSTANTSSIDPVLWGELGVSREWHDAHLAMEKSYEKMGILKSYTCAPYQLGHVPRLGQHVAWGEAAAIPYCNSVLGARTNRHGGPTCLAAALTGRVPLYGYHLDENRRGDWKVIVDARLDDIADYGALGYCVGSVVNDAVPVFVGIPQDVSIPELKALGTALSCSGAVALYHVVGVTPEAATEQQALGGSKVKDSQIIRITDEDLARTRQALSKSDSELIDVVLLGCPHASITEIQDVARQIEGKRIRSSALFIYTAAPIKAYADRSGYTRIIEEAGGRIVSGTCPLCTPKDCFQNIGYRTSATNAAKLAHHVPGSCYLKVQYGSTKRCIEAALTGTWR